MSTEGILDWMEDDKKFSVTVNYDDPASTPPLAVTPGDAGSIKKAAENNAAQLSSKMYGKDVREALAQWVLLAGYLLDKGILSLKEFESAMQVFEGQVDNRMVAVEKRQTTVENDFQKVIANATQDSEVILARDSTIYGRFGVLDQRLENIEQMLAMAIPAGYTVTINHGLGRNPTVVVCYYEYAIGTEPAGLGTGPAGTFGGTPAKTLETTVSYPDANTVKIELPAGFALNGSPVYQPADGCWYIIDGYRTLRFDLGVKLGVDDPDTSGGSSSTTGGETPSDPKDDEPVTPTNVTFTKIDDTTGRLDWQAE